MQNHLIWALGHMSLKSNLSQPLSHLCSVNDSTGLFSRILIFGPLTQFKIQKLSNDC